MSAGAADAAALTLEEHCAAWSPGAVADDLDHLRSVAERLPRDRAGLRIAEAGELSDILDPAGSIGRLAASDLGPAARPVRAILFDKTAATNWSLAWHQDRTVCVRARREVTGFGPWTVKSGLLHVAPPFDLLTRMVTLRIHLDDTPATNAPLLIAPGSQRCGLVPEPAIEDVVRRCGRLACLAAAGDVWRYATPILHASDAALRPTRRRVLQIDYAAEDLPDGLEWLGLS